MSVHWQIDISVAILPLIQQPVVNGSQSGFLFLGGNKSLPVCGGHSPIDLTGIPSAYNAMGFSFNSTTALHSYDSLCANLASVLVCDPQISLSGGEVTLQSNGHLTVNSADLASVGNIPIAAIEIPFSQGLLSAVITPEPDSNSSTIVNFISALLFMTDLTMNTDNHPTGIPPLHVDIINGNMDTFVGSAVKAYADGHFPGNGTLPYGGFNTVEVRARQQEQRLALVTDVPLWTATMSLVALSAILLTWLAVMWKRRDPFDLRSIMKATQVSFSSDQLPLSRPLLPASQPTPTVESGNHSGQHYDAAADLALSAPAET
jgi:hypothetical protein